jgi:hypothetical protein
MRMLISGVELLTWSRFEPLARTVLRQPAYETGGSIPLLCTHKSTTFFRVTDLRSQLEVPVCGTNQHVHRVNASSSRCAGRNHSLINSLNIQVSTIDETETDRLTRVSAPQGGTPSQWHRLQPVRSTWRYCSNWRGLLTMTSSAVWSLHDARGWLGRIDKLKLVAHLPG